MLDKKVAIAGIIVLILLICFSVYLGCNGRKEYFSGRTLYYFNNPGCGHCKGFDPMWDQLVTRLDDIEAKKIDTTDPNNQQLSFYFQVKGTPTIILVTDKGNKTFAGPRTVENLEKFARQ